MGDMESILMTAIVFGLLSITFYFLFFKPATPNDGGRVAGQQQQQYQAMAGARAAAAGRNNNNNVRPMAAPGAGATAAAAASSTPSRGDDNSNSKHIEAILSKYSSHPEHLSVTSQGLSNVGGTNLLVEGMVAFRYTRAAQYESSLSKTATASTASAAADRKARARLLSRLFNLEQDKSTSSSKSSSTSKTETATTPTAAATGATAPTTTAAAASTQTTTSTNSTTAAATTTTRSQQAPPTRGSTIVLSVPKEDVTCSKLKYILYLLGTYYNMLLIVAIKEDDPDYLNATTAKATDSTNTNFRLQKEFASKIITQVRGVENEDDKNNEYPNFLPKDILPDHRIIVSASTSGRIAFVRQLLPSPSSSRNTELVIDFNSEVKTQLNRFGYKVILYGQETDSQKKDATSTTSLLGSDIYD